MSTHTYGLPEGPKNVFLAWWHTIASATPTGPARADRASLRRAHSVVAVACEPAYQRLYRQMAEANGGQGWSDVQRTHIAALVGLSAHLKDKDSLSLPQAMSQRADGEDRNPVSALRFRRLLEAPDIDALFTGLRRVLPLIERRVSPARLADDVFAWGDGVRQRWAYDYRWPD